MAENVQDMRVIFMGTPDFAVPSLDILVKNNCNIVAVVTTPDRPAGRGLKLQESAVKKNAIKHDLPVLQPEKLKDPTFINQLQTLKPDLMVVVAFRILPEVVYTIPTHGAFNLHASLLPDYRGAAPINWAIINGEKETGVTTFFLARHVDTGNIIFQEKVKIAEDDTAGDLHDKLMEEGAELILKTVKAIAEGNAPNQRQPEVLHEKKAPKIFTDDCKIDFTRSLGEAYNFVRGLSPYPAAWTEIDGKRVKIFQATKEYTIHTEKEGEVVTDGRSFFKLSFPDGYLNILELQMEGKKKMKVDEFLKGYRK